MQALSLLIAHSHAEHGNERLEGYDPSLIRQQHHKFRGFNKDAFFLALRVSEKIL